MTLFDAHHREPAIGIVHEWTEDDGGLLISVTVEDAIYRQLTQPPLMFGSIGFGHPPRPLTRRQRIRYRLRRVQGYFRHLGLALIGRCDRERYDW